MSVSREVVAAGVAGALGGAAAVLLLCKAKSLRAEAEGGEKSEPEVNTQCMHAWLLPCS